MRIISKPAGKGKGKVKQHSAVLQLGAYRKQTDSCLSLSMHYEEFPGKARIGEAPSCALYQTAEQENGWMRDRTGEGIMAVPRYLMTELLKHARAVVHMSEAEKIHAMLWSGLKQLPYFADDIPRRPVEDFQHITLPQGVRRFIWYYPS